MGRINPNSKRGRIHLAFNAGGQEAADKLAQELGIAESKRKRWFRKWADGSGSKANGVDDKQYHPRWSYDSEEAARKAADAQAKGNDSDPSIFVVVSNGQGKLAFVPKHVAGECGGAPTEPGVFKKGQRVLDLTATHRLGVIVRPGEEVSEVRWDATGAVQNESNDYLGHITVAAAKPRRALSKSKRDT